MNTPMRMNRPGMTLVEMLLALTVFAVVLVAASRALQDEVKVFAAGNERMAVVQNYRYALGSIEQDVRLAGTGVVASQPSLVYAGQEILAFNADYASRSASDISAVFYEPDAPAAAVSALTRELRAALPVGGFFYPDSSFLFGGVNSPAETIVFFFDEDLETDRDDDLALYRQVNHMTPERLAGRLLTLDGRPFFEYTELVQSDTAPDALRPIPVAALPLAHSVPKHGMAADTGTAGRVDRIRAVRVNFAAASDGELDHVERVSRIIWLHNVRQNMVQTCGDEPLGIAAPVLTAGINTTSGDPEVRIQWNASADETGGEGDVVRYLLWRRAGGVGPWGDPYLSLPAGNTSYVYVDGAVERGLTYGYAVSAQDCTPTLSAQSPASLVIVPAS